MEPSALLFLYPSVHTIEDSTAIIIGVPHFMLIQQNSMRMHRKRSGLLQSDIAVLSNVNGRKTVAKYEKGINKYPIEFLLIYQILFSVPIDSLFDRQKQQVLERLGGRLENRIGQLKALKPRPKTVRRLSYLEGALEKLKAGQY